MVGDELHRHEDDAGVACRGEIGDQVLEVRGQPLLGCVSCALVTELPLVIAEPDPLGDTADRLVDLREVSGVALDDRLRKAVRGEDDWKVSHLGDRVAHPLGQRVDPTWHVMPGARDVDGHGDALFLGGGVDSAVVAAHDQR